MNASKLSELLRKLPRTHQKTEEKKKGLLSNNTSFPAHARRWSGLSAQELTTGQMESVRKSSISTNHSHKLPSEKNSNPHNQPATLLPTTTFFVTLHGPTPAQRPREAPVCTRGTLSQTFFLEQVVSNNWKGSQPSAKIQTNLQPTGTSTCTQPGPSAHQSLGAAARAAPGCQDSSERTPVPQLENLWTIQQ